MLPSGDAGAVEPPPPNSPRCRLDHDGLTVLAYRFKGDRFCRAERFAAYAEALGDRFLLHVLPGEAANRRELPPLSRRT